MTKISKEEQYKIAMQIIANSGESKSYSVIALRKFANDDEEKAVQESLEKARDFLEEASVHHLDLQKKEAQGLMDRMELISIHAEDQFMNAMNWLDISQEMITLIEKKLNKKGK